MLNKINLTFWQIFYSIIKIISGNNIVLKYLLLEPISKKFNKKKFHLIILISFRLKLIKIVLDEYYGKV